MYKLIFTASYEKLFKKWLKKHPDLKDKYYKTIQLLEFDPYHNSLRLHALKGEISEFHSVSIDMRQRIIIDFYIEETTIVLLKIGDHSIYKN